MKALYTSLIVAGLIAITGCNTSPTGGGAGGTGRSGTGPSGTGGSGSHGERSKATFKLSGPTNIVDTTVKHGATVTKDISVDAGKDFKEDIAFETKVDPDGKGVTAMVEPNTWKASGPKKVELKVKADDKAAQGEYTIHVTGKPATGEPTTLDVKVKVPEKK